MKLYPLAWEINNTAGSPVCIVEFFTSEVKRRKARADLNRLAGAGIMPDKIITPHTMEVPLKAAGLLKISDFSRAAAVGGIEWVEQQMAEAERRGDFLL